MHCKRRSQGSAGSAQSAIQREFTQEPPTSETILVDDTGGTEDSDCDRQIESSPTLAEFRGCEIDGHSTIGEAQTGGRDRAANPRHTFSHSGFG
jgi:hypothetical protein